MTLHKFYYCLLALLCTAFFVSCDDDEKDAVPDIQLVASLSSFEEGVESFDTEGGILTLSKENVLTSSLTFADAQGADMSNITLKASVPASEKIWCTAACSKTRLSLSVAKNNTENARQVTIEVSACFGDLVLDTYSLIVIQKGEEPEEVTAGADITTFLIAGQISSKIEYPVITVTMPTGTDITALKPAILTSAGATVTPASGVAQDFSDVVQYTVISADQQSMKTYLVVVTVQAGGNTGTTPGTNEDNPNWTAFNMVTVGAGSFIIGKDLSGLHSDKNNAHKVNLSTFEIGRYEVTQYEFKDVMGYNPSTNQGSELYPVHKVTLFEAMLYCNRLSERKGYQPVYTFSNEVWDTTNTELLEATVTRNKSANGYRLPTNAEWEYAAKGGPDSENQPYYYAGSNEIDDVCWYRNNSQIGEKASVHVVGLKQPNSLGIYDMSGNIEEYTGEWFAQLGYISDAEETNPWGPDSPRYSDSWEVISRGGEFDTYDSNCSTIDSRFLSGNIKTDADVGGGSIWYDSIGFRVVRSLE